MAPREPEEDHAIWSHTNGDRHTETRPVSTAERTINWPMVTVALASIAFAVGALFMTPSTGFTRPPPTVSVNHPGFLGGSNL
jgi:hypothetical protein